MELEKHITDEKPGINYTLCGYYYLPDLVLPDRKGTDCGNGRNEGKSSAIRLKQRKTVQPSRATPHPT